MKGGLSFAATTSRLQLAYACLVGGQMVGKCWLYLYQATCYNVQKRHPSTPSREMQVYPQLPQWAGNTISILWHSFDNMTLGISWYSVSPYFSRRMSPGASNAAPQCSENLCGCCRFLSCQELSHDLPQIFRSRQARDGSKVDDLDMFGALGRFTVFRCYVVSCRRW